MIAFSSSCWERQSWWISTSSSTRQGATQPCFYACDLNKAYRRTVGPRPASSRADCSAHLRQPAYSRDAFQIDCSLCQIAPWGRQRGSRRLDFTCIGSWLGSYHSQVHPSAHTASLPVTSLLATCSLQPSVKSTVGRSRPPSSPSTCVSDLKHRNLCCFCSTTLRISDYPAPHPQCARWNFRRVGCLKMASLHLDSHSSEPYSG